MNDATPRPTPRRIDWDAIALDYCANVLPDGHLCAKYGISLVNLRRMAKKHGWERVPKPESPSPLPTGGNVEPSIVWSPDEARKQQIMQITAITRAHRHSVSRLFAAANLLSERLIMILDGVDIERPCLGPRESPADLLVKLSKVTFTAVQLEREILGLSSVPGSDDPEDENTEFIEVRKMLEDMHAVKVGDVHVITQPKKEEGK